MHESILEKTRDLYKNRTLKMDIFLFYLCIVLVSIVIAFIFSKLFAFRLLLQSIISITVPTFFVISTYNAIKNNKKLSFTRSFKEIFIENKKYLFFRWIGTAFLIFLMAYGLYMVAEIILLNSVYSGSDPSMLFFIVSFIAAVISVYVLLATSIASFYYAAYDNRKIGVTDAIKYSFIQMKGHKWFYLKTILKKMAIYIVVTIVFIAVIVTIMVLDAKIAANLYLGGNLMNNLGPALAKDIGILVIAMLAYVIYSIVYILYFFIPYFAIFNYCLFEELNATNDFGLNNDIEVRDDTNYYS